MSALRLAPDLHFGCLRISNADTLSLSEVFLTSDEGEVSITLTADNPEPWQEHTLASIRMFKLPAGSAEFERQVEWFGRKCQKRARLPDGMPFTPETLAIQDASDFWSHEAYPRSGRDFIHIHRNESQAVLIRLMGKSEPILDNPLFASLHKSLRLDEGQWIRAFPATTMREGALAGIEELPLPSDVETEVRDAVGRALEQLNLESIYTPAAAAEAIHEALTEIRRGAPIGAEERKQQSVDLGALWGDALVSAAGWEWCCLRQASGVETYAVCRPGRSHAVDPIALVHGILTALGGATNSLLTFNMIAAGEVPASAPGAYSWLT